MTDLPRLNGVIRAFESGHPAFATFSHVSPESAIALQGSGYDGVVFETEHNMWDGPMLRDALQYLLNRGQIARAGSVAPAITPLVRIPPNGMEKNQFFAKQALDLGAFGIVWPHVSTVEQAYNAVAACRYPRMRNQPLYEPAGQRGDGPTAAVRYWGVSQQEYYERADVWPLEPHGELLVILMIEDVEGIENLGDILSNVPGIGALLIGEGDLSQELGIPRQYEHPVLLDHMRRIREVAKEHDVAVGHPHVDLKNIDSIVEEGYRFIMPAPERTYRALDRGLQLIGRK